MGRLQVPWAFVSETGFMHRGLTQSPASVRVLVWGPLRDTFPWAFLFRTKGSAEFGAAYVDGNVEKYFNHSSDLFIEFLSPASIH